MALARLVGANGMQEVSSFETVELGAGSLVRAKRAKLASCLPNHVPSVSIAYGVQGAIEPAGAVYRLLPTDTILCLARTFVVLLDRLFHHFFPFVGFQGLGTQVSGPE